MAIAKLDSGAHWAVSFDDKATWTPIYVPAPNIKIEHTNVASADSGRTEDGVMHITWVRRDVKKVNLMYNAISGAEKATMEALMQGKEFYFRYYDPHYEGNTLVNVSEFYGYCGESSYQAYAANVYDKSDPLHPKPLLRSEEGGIYTNFSINVIEF